jgi:hypothetical protein
LKDKGTITELDLNELMDQLTAWAINWKDKLKTPQQKTLKTDTKTDSKSDNKSNNNQPLKPAQDSNLKSRLNKNNNWDAVLSDINDKKTSERCSYCGSK